MSDDRPRREVLLDAAIELLGREGVRGVTHRAVDVAAGLPLGSASNLFRTRDALFDAVAGRVTERELAAWEDLALRLLPRTPAETAAAIALFIREAATSHAALSLARYAILLEAARRPELRAALSVTGARVNARFLDVLRAVGSSDPERDMHLLLNYGTGLLIHQLALPDPDFDPTVRLTQLLESLITREPPWTSTRPGEPSTVSGVP